MAQFVSDAKKVRLLVANDVLRLVARTTRKAERRNLEQAACEVWLKGCCGLLDDD